MRSCLVTRWKAHGWLSIRVNWTFCYLWRFRSYEAKVYSSAVFARGSTSLHSNLPGQGGPPSTIFGTRKLETLGYWQWRPHPSAFPRFETTVSVWDRQMDRQADGRICCRIYSACKASFRRDVKTEHIITVCFLEAIWRLHVVQSLSIMAQNVVE